MKTMRSTMWTWCAGLTLAAAVACLAPVQAEAAYSGSGTFNLITSTADITSGGYYVFVGGGTSLAMASSAIATTATAALSGQAVTISANAIVDPDVGRVWKIDSVSGNFSILNEAGSIYIGHAGANNGMAKSAANSSTVYHWSFATTASSFVVRNIASTDRMIRWNSGNPRFACYSTGQTPVQLYKLAEASEDPVITLSGTLSAFSTTYGIPSAAQSFTTAGENLTDDITVAAPAGFQVSLASGSGYANSIDLTQTDGTVESTTVYIRLTGAATGAFSGDVTASSDGADNKTLAASGAVGLVAPVATAATDILTDGFTANWEAVSGATSYSLDVSEYETFSEPGGEPVNLVANSGFETGDWTSWTLHDASYTIASSDPYAGTYHVTCAPAATVNMAQSVSITGDGTTSYEVSFYYKKPSATGSFRIWATWTTGGQVSGDSLQPATYLPAATEWTKVTYNVVPNSGANVLSFNVRTYNTASVSLDNFFVGVPGSGSTPSFVLEDEDVGDVTEYDVTDLEPGTEYFYRVRATAGSVVSDNSNVESATTDAGAVPTITLSAAALSAFSTVVGTPSAAQSFTVAGEDLTADITVTAPAGYEVSEDEESDYDSSVVLSQIGGTVDETTIYVRLTGAAVGSFSGDIEATSDGATDKTKAVTGEVAGPTITLSAAALSAFSTVAGTPSAAQSFTVAGENLTADITVTAPAGYEVSEDVESDYDSAVVLSQFSGTVEETTVYVRLTGAAAGSFSGDIEATSTDADTQTKAASGTVGLTAPVATAATDILTDGFTANWEVVTGATGYRLDVSTEEDFQTGSAGGLFISEVADPSDMANARFVELYNATASAIDFSVDTWYLSRQANGSTWGDILLTGTVPAGGTHVVAYSLATFTNSYYPRIADQYDVTISGNGDDGYFLYSGGDHTAGTLVDVYGVLNEDGTGMAWEYTDSNAVRKASIALPNSTWTASEWTLASAAVADMTPGEHTCTGGATPSFVLEDENVGNVTTYDVTGLDSGVEYFYRVRATAGSVVSDNSNVESATTESSTPTITLSAAALSAFSTVVGTPSAAQSFTAAGENLTDDITVAAPAGYEVSEDEESDYDSSVVLSQIGGTVDETTIYVRLTGAAVGSFSGDVTASSDGATDKTKAVTGEVAGPTITLSAAALSAFSTVCGTPSAAQSFTVAGVNLTADIGVYPPGGFQVSESEESGYADSIELTQSGGTVEETTVYVRLTGAAPGEFSGDIVAASTDADNKTKAASGTVGLAAPMATAATDLLSDGFTANWEAVTGATAYSLDVSEYETFSEPGGEPVNLVANFGFETGDNTGWTATVDHSVDTTSPYAGTYVEKCAATATRSLVQAVSITGDGVTAYEISYWYRVTGGDGTDVRIWSSWSAGGATGDSLQPTAYNTSSTEWTKKTYTVVPNSGANTLNMDVRVYNGATVYLDNFFVGVPGSGPTPSFVLEDEDVGNVTEYDVTGLDAETTYYYRVRATADDGAIVSEDSNVIEATTESDEPIEVTVSGAVAQDKDYDAGTDATVDFTSATLVGVVGGDDVELDYSAYSASFADADAGTWDVTVSGLFLTGDDAGKYTLTQPTLSADIDPLAITISPDADQSKIYGEDDPAVFTYGADPALLGADEFTGALGRDEGEDVGFYAFTLGNLSAGGNYSLSLVAEAEEFEITKATATVNLYNLTGQVYDGTPKAVLVETDPEGLSITVTYDGETDPPTDAGSYAVVATVVDDNYEGSNSGDLVIDMADQTINGFDDPGDQYTDDTIDLSGVSASSGLTVEFDVTGPASLVGTTVSFTGEGEVTITASQAGNANWNPAEDVGYTFQVTERTLAAEIVSDAINVREGGEGRFYVRLNQAPEGNVLVTVTRTAGDAGLSVLSGATMTFSPANWNQWRRVVLQAAADGNDVNETATFEIAIGGAVTELTATALDDEIGENLALASSGTKVTRTTGAYGQVNLIDGVHLSSANYGYTLTTADPAATITLDLLAETTVSRIRLLNFDWLKQAQRYKLEGSTDNATWTDLAPDAQTTDRQGWDDWAVEDVAVRYVRFTGMNNSLGASVRVAELEIYGTRSLDGLPQPEISPAPFNVREGGEGRFYVRLDQEPESDVVVTVTRSAGDANITVASGAALAFTPANWDVWRRVTLAAAADANEVNDTATIRVATPWSAVEVEATSLDGQIGDNLALGAAVTRTTGAYGLAALNDGIHTSSANYAYTVNPEATITVDLGAEETVACIRLLNYDWIRQGNRYKLEGSTDNENWTDLAPAAQTSDRQGWDEWVLEDVSIRYVRFTGTANTLSASVRIAELEIFSPPAMPLRKSATLTRVGSEPVAVLTSDGPEDETGWNVLDGDPTTAWVGQKAGGGYLVIEYQPALKLSALEVELAEDSLAGMEALTSQDGVEWQPLPDDAAGNPVSLNFLWLVFPDDGTDAVPNVLEIWPNP